VGEEEEGWQRLGGGMRKGGGVAKGGGWVGRGSRFAEIGGGCV